MKRTLFTTIVALAVAGCTGTDGAGGGGADTAAEDLVFDDAGGLDTVFEDGFVSPDTSLDVPGMDTMGEDTPMGEDTVGEDTVGEDVPMQDLTGEDTETPCEPGEGCFLDPCDDNADCLSAFCVEHMGEDVCTMPCVEECPTGWSCKTVDAGPDLMSVCVSDVATLCRPCEGTADCASAGVEDVCVDYGDAAGAFCGGACADDGDCPDGYTCDDVTTTEGVETTQCVPAGGECACADKSVALGLSTTCAIQNDAGTCAGTRSCTEAGLSDCDAAVPAEDLCDGEDNDCDGAIDAVPCDDMNPCTDDSCAGADGCVYTPNDANACDDNDVCTVDACEAGACVTVSTLECGEGCGVCAAFTNSYCDAGACSCMPDDCAGMGIACGALDDGCGNTLDCGACAEFANSFCADGACACTADTCAGMGYACGSWDDGCGGTFECGACEDFDNSYCGDDGTCACSPFNCGDLAAECGSHDDGCGDMIDCGTCGVGFVCEMGICEGTLGDTCLLPFLVDAHPFTGEGDTTGFASDYGYTVAGACPPEEGAYGAGAPDQAYAFTPAAMGLYRISLDSAPGFDSNLYIVTDCADVDNSCVAGDEDICTDCTESVEVELDATPYYVIVDGFTTSDTPDNAGAYSLTIEEIGDTCGDALLVDAVPFQWSGSTVAAGDDYGYSDGVCPPESGGWGAGAPDEVFLFTPTVTAFYAIQLDASYDSNLYVVSDCADIDNSCVAGDEDICSSCVEDVTPLLEAGVTYYIIVDGFGGGSAGAYTLSIETNCVPGTCDSLGYGCGEWEDGCGGVLECGGCDDFANSFCSDLGQCDCAPTTCEALGFTCDSWDDGCGGMADCGGCAGGEACVTGMCVGAGGGDTCASPFILATLPADVTGDTTDASPDYGYSAGQCPPESGGYGGGAGTGAPDEVWAFTPTVSDGYHITLTGTDFDSNLYVVEDCGDIGGTCVGGDEDICSNCTESLDLDLTAGTTYFIVVDGWSTSSVTNDGAYALHVERQGDTCATAIPVGALPFGYAGDTTGFGNQYGYTNGQCPGENTYGNGAADEVFSFTAPETADYHITLEGVGFDSNLYVVTDCADMGTCLGADEDICSNCTEDLWLSLEAGMTYYIIVDGYSNSSLTNDGPFVLTVSEPCVPLTCADMGTECGAMFDGCGADLDCGSCGSDDCLGGICYAVGDTCDNPRQVGALPFTGTGDTLDATSQHGYDAGQCPPETGGYGDGAPDEVWTFVPAADGYYRISLSGNYDSNLYIITDCADAGGSCVAGDEDICTGCTETIEPWLDAGVTYFIIVDGFSNSNADNGGTYTLTVEPLTGDTCADALPVGALPFSASGDTSDATPDYGYDAGQCPPETGGWGDGSADEVYAFTPAVTADYLIAIDTNYDSNLFVVTDCGNIGGTCVAGDEDIGTSANESVVASLVAGTTYYVIVDGWNNSANTTGAYTLTIDLAP